MTATTSKRFILLPAYNEARALEQLIPAIQKAVAPLGQPYEILVVDDGSRDDTAVVIDRLKADIPVQRLVHSANRGYGATLLTGFEHVLAQAGADDVVVTMDSDNTHDPQYIASLLSCLEKNDFGIVTASYSCAGGKAYGVPPYRRLMSAGVNLLFRLVYPLGGLTTYTNGYRIYRLSALRKAQERFGHPLIRENGFPGGAELFLKVCRAGARPGEVAFDLHYENRGADSKINLPQTIRRYLKLLRQAWAIRFS